MAETSLKKQIMSGMVWKFAERFIAQGVSFVVSLVLARILMPSDYGIIAIINVFITIADVLLTSGLNTALIQKQDVDELYPWNGTLCDPFRGGSVSCHCI